MALEYHGVPDWCGEAANRRRLEEWYASFGAGGIPCSVCQVRKLTEDFRALAQHLAAGKEQVRVAPAGPAQRARTWSIGLLGAPAAIVDGKAEVGLQIVHLQLTCSRCSHVLLFDAKAIGIAL